MHREAPHPGRGDRVEERRQHRPRGPASSTPIRHFTVTGTGPAAAIIAAAQSATSAGVRISAAPKQPDCTRSDGQPTLRLISSNPISRPTAAAAASASGSDAAELQRQRPLHRVEAEQPLPVAAQHRAGRHHLGVEQRSAG